MDNLGKEVEDTWLIAKNYFMGTFIIDFLSGLPIEHFTHSDFESQSIIDPKF